MAPCAGMPITTVCMDTFRIRSAIGMISRRPGWRICRSRRPNRRTTPCSYCCTRRTLDASSANATTMMEMSRAVMLFPQNGDESDVEYSGALRYATAVDLPALHRTVRKVAGGGPEQLVDAVD